MLMANRKARSQIEEGSEDPPSWDFGAAGPPSWDFGVAGPPSWDFGAAGEEEAEAENEKERFI